MKRFFEPQRFSLALHPAVRSLVEHDQQLARGIPVACGYINCNPVDRPTGSVHWLPRLIQPALGSYQDVTDANLGSLGTSISAAQTLGLAGDCLARVGPICAWWHD
jgi:hypothetical protein